MADGRTESKLLYLMLFWEAEISPDEYISHSNVLSLIPVVPPMDEAIHQGVIPTTSSAGFLSSYRPSSSYIL